MAMMNLCQLMWGPQRAINCYIILTIWILIIIAGVYKFLEPVQPLMEATLIANPFQRLENNVKTKKIFQICNEPHNILPGEEGITTDKSWLLKGILIVIRHGDRGPLQHIRNISTVKCGTPETSLLTAFKNYIHNLTVSGKVVTWIGPGSFHGFPLLPVNQHHCHLGQLTMQGVSQLLKLGNLLKESYMETWPKIRNLSQADVIVYSTRYHRTFQSALALLFGLIPSETLSRLSFIESQSMTFCFKECGCPVTEKYLKFVAKAAANNLKTHPAIQHLAHSTGNLIFSPDAAHGHFDPQSVRDALFTYICHDSVLPCDSMRNCIRQQNILGIFMYHEWMMNQLWKNRDFCRLSLLRSYGLVKHLVNQMLQMLSNNGPYLVLYSGHDHTLMQLASALGIQHDPLLCRYAGRFVFEVYSNAKESQNASGAYFRLLVNGRDVTRQVTFCKSARTLQEHLNVCRIEDIIRFIHDDYFAHFNATNFKDACFAKNVHS